MSHTLLFLDPGHFHAALTLRRADPRVERDVHLYAPPGPDAEAFVSLVESFNARAEDPTAWRIVRHDGERPLEALLAERRGDVAVLAGRNATKLAAIAALHRAGVHVLADKPWLTTNDALADLEAVTTVNGEATPLATDIMTGRWDIVARVRRRVVASPALFGALASEPERGPAIEVGSVHHLYKQVNGRALRRPPWYYDVDVQGDGLVDIQSHMTDQAQWLVGDEHEFDFDRDFELTGARRWSTPVPLDLYEASTGQSAFPRALADRAKDGALSLACNGEIDYRLRGVTVRQRAEWGQREPEGGGDLHSAIVRGTRAEAIVRQGPQTRYVPELHVAGLEGTDIGSEVRDHVESWREAFPGLEAVPSDIGFRLVIPSALQSSHESHFPMVLAEFLDLVDSGKRPAPLAPRIRSRYTLLARAREMAGQSGEGSVA